MFGRKMKGKDNTQDMPQNFRSLKNRWMSSNSVSELDKSNLKYLLAGAEEEVI